MSYTCTKCGTGGLNDLGEHEVAFHSMWVAARAKKQKEDNNAISEKSQGTGARTPKRGTDAGGTDTSKR